MKKISYILLILIWMQLPVLAQTPDKIAPEKPNILKLTVDTADNKAVLTWQASPSSDVAHYILFLQNGSFWNATDTVGFLQRTCKSNISKAGEKSENYALVAEDSSRNNSAIEGVNGIYSTIYLDAKYDSCSNLIKLQWNNYEPMPNESSQFLLHVYLHNEGWQTPITLNGDVFEYTFTGVSDKYEAFFVEKSMPGLKVSSNKSTLKLLYYPHLQIDSFWLSVENESTAMKAFYTNGKSSEKILLYTGQNCQTQQLLGSFTPDQSKILTFNDITNNISSSRTYTLQVQDRCANTIQTICQSPIVLSGKQTSNGIWLNWINTNHSQLDLYRIENVNETYISSFIDTLYLDNWNNIQLSDEGNICYLLKDKTRQSLSNIFCVETSGMAIIPDAFTPDGNGKNDFFKPVFPGYTPEYYHLIIFDNNGRQVYESKSINDNGWDGKLFGQKAYNGQVCLYLLQYTDNKKNKFTRKGSLTVLLP